MTTANPRLGVGSMMSSAVIGETPAEIDELAERFHRMMTSEDDTDAGIDPSGPVQP